MVTERAMMLEQLRDDMRAYGDVGTSLSAADCIRIADAIDAHLRAEPVGYASAADLEKLQGLGGGFEMIPMWGQRGRDVANTPLFPHPTPAQAQDARDAARWRKVRRMGVFKPGPPMECGFVFNESADAVVDDAMAREGE